MKKVITAIAALVFALSVNTVVAYPFDWATVMRNVDDSGYDNIMVPTRATTSAAVLGSPANSDYPLWFYFNNCFPIVSTTTVYGSAKVITFDPYCTNDLNTVFNAIDLLTLSKVSTTTRAADLASIQGQIEPLLNLSTMSTEINANLFGTSTTMLANNASTSNGFMTKSQSNKLDAYPSYSSLLSSMSSGTVSSVGATSSDFTISGSPVTSSGTITLNLNATGTPGTYTKVTTNNKGIVVSGSNRTFNNNVSRSFNSNYTISTTSDAFVTYSINTSWSLGIAVGGAASSTLQYSTNGGSSWNTVSSISKNISALTVAFTGSDDMNLSGTIPAGALARIVTASNNMTITYVRGQEVLE